MDSVVFKGCQRAWVFNLCAFLVSLVSSDITQSRKGERDAKSVANLGLTSFALL